MRLTPLAVVFVVALTAQTFGAATVHITSPTDQTFVNPGGGTPGPIDVSYQVTGNTCTGFRSSFAIQPYVNGDPVLCSGSGCSCDGTTENCNNISKTITLDGNDFDSCMNTIEISLDPAPFQPVLCITPGPAVFSSTIAVWQSPRKECTDLDGCNQSTVGNPVDVATGKMYHEIVDMKISGPLPIEFLRRYDSQSSFNAELGFGWQHAYQMRIEPDGNRQVFVDRRGRRIYFGKNAQGVWQENRIEHLALTAPGSPTWRVTDKHQTKYEFDGSGRLTQIVDRNGNATVLGYTGSDLTSITDGFGRAMTLAYDGNNRLQTLTAATRTATYTYNNGTSNLERVDWSDGSFVTYEYNDTDVHNLTAAKDSFGNVIEEHTYDGLDRVMSTQSDGGNFAYTISYDSSTQTTVTNSRSIDTVFTHDSFAGLVTTNAGPGCSSCGNAGVSATREFDEFLNLTKLTDAVGVVTDMTYDGKGNLLTRTEAVGTPEERTWIFTWNPTFSFLSTTTIPSVGTCANPNRVTTNTYDGATGDLLTEQVTGCAGSATFSHTVTHTFDSHGQLATTDGPRTDVTDVTAYDYYADGDADINLRGRLELVTNALGHETAYAGYDLFGNVGSVTHPNNVEMDLLYDEKDRVTETRIKGAVPADDIVTEQAYDLEGNLDLVRLPNCVEVGVGCAFSLDYTYDTVNRLTEIIDPFGNKIVYTYDTEGNRTREEYRDASSVVRRFTNFNFDDFNRLEYTYFNVIVPENPGSVFSKNTYFDDGYLHSERDPEGHVTTSAYDVLKRLQTVTQTVGVDTLTTIYGYDIQDNLSSITDPEGLVTAYTNHDVGWRLSAVSPDTGTTTYGHDLVGNITSVMDANGVTTNRAYDALNRPIAVTYPDVGLNVTYSYDSLAVTFGVGRRTGMTDASGSAVYGYDPRELLTREEKTIGSNTYVTQYAYDKTGNLTQVLYPTNDAVVRQGQADYTYDAADRVAALTTQVNAATTSVASSLAYKPFGPPTSMTLGNGLVDARTYGTRYQLGNWTTGSLLDYTHVFDADLNLTSRTDNLNAANNRTLGYDEIHRLTAAAGPWGPATNCTGGATYTYDRNGNRLCKGEESPATNYGYLPGTNQLDAATGGEPAVYSHNATGNITSDGTHTYDYSDADRLAVADSGTTTTYTYDGDGHRIIRSAGSTTTYFFYDPDGRLLSETVLAAASGKDYLYLLGDPVGRVDWTTEQSLGSVLRVDKSAPDVQLDWTLYPGSSNDYIVRRKHVVNPNDRTFGGNEVIATVSDPTQTYDDSVLNDGNNYEYRVFRRALSESLLFYHADHLSTPVAMTDGSGTLVWRAEYLPFGGLWSVPVSTVANDLRFPGQYSDFEVPLYYNLHRWYGPETGRYTRADPVGALRPGIQALFETNHLYSYAASNPLFFIDPLGLRVVIDNSLVQERYDELKSCFPFFKVLMSNFEGVAPVYNARVTDPPRRRPDYSCNASGPLQSAFGLKVWINTKETDTCQEIMGCLFHEFFETWLVGAGGYERSFMGGGPADDRAREFEKKIPFDKCCPPCKEK